MGDSGLFPEDGELYDDYSAKSSRSRSRSRSRGYRRRHHKSHRSRKSRRHSSRRHRHRRYRSRSRSVSRSYTRSRSRSHSRRRRSRSPRRSPSYTRSPMKRRRYFGTRENPHRSNCLGIFGLNTSTSEGQLTELFSKYGKLDKVTIVYDAKTMMSRGFGFIYFQNVQDAEYARSECNGMTIDEKRIRVDFSITKRAHTPTPGIYMGNYVNSGYPERMASREAHSSRKSGSYRRTRSGSLPRSRSRSRH